MRSAPHCRVRGFTLIELLVVLLMIGIILTFAALSLHGDPAKEHADEEIHRMARLIELASEEAITRGLPLGLRLEQHGYRFMGLKGQDWIPLADDKLMRHRDLPPELSLQLYVDGLPVTLPKDKSLSTDASERDAAKPQVIFLTTGEMTPAEIRLVADHDAADSVRMSLSIPMLGKPTITNDES